MNSSKILTCHRCEHRFFAGNFHCPKCQTVSRISKIQVIIAVCVGVLVIGLGNWDPNSTVIDWLQNQ